MKIRIKLQITNNIFREQKQNVIQVFSWAKSAEEDDRAINL